MNLEKTMGKSKERRERRRVSAERRIKEHHVGFGSTSIKLPDGKSFFQPKKEGTYRLEIIPYVVPEGAGNPFADDGDYYFERTFFTHRGIGPNKGTYICLFNTVRQPCPICEYLAKLAKEDKKDEDLIKSLGAKERQLWNVFDHDNPEDGVKVWDISFYLFGERLQIEVKNGDEDENLNHFADPDRGKTLKVVLEEKFFMKKPYYNTATISFKERRKPLADEILDEAVVLDDTLIITEYDQLNQVFLQIDSRTDRKTEDKSGEENTSATAEDLDIHKDDEVLYEEKTCTVIRISGDGTSLTLVDENQQLYKGVAPDEVIVSTEDDNPNPSPNVEPEDTTTSPSPSPSGETKDSSKDEENWDDWSEDD